MICSTHMMVTPARRECCAAFGRLVHLGLVEPARLRPPAAISARSPAPWQLELLQAGRAQPSTLAPRSVGRPTMVARVPRPPLPWSAVPALPEIAGQRHVLEHRNRAVTGAGSGRSADAAIDDPVRRETESSVPANLIGTRRRQQRAGEHVENRALAEPFGPIRPRISP